MNMHKTVTRMRNSVLGVIAIIGLSGFSGQQVLSEGAILAEQLSPAAAWVDPSASGEQALFVAGKDSNALYVNQGDGTFVDMAHELGIDRSYIPGTAIHSDATDLNSDGCTDLYVRDDTLDTIAIRGKGTTHVIYLNDCNGGFTVLRGGELDASSEADLEQALAAQTEVIATSVHGEVVVLGTTATDFIRITTTSGDTVVDVLKDGTMKRVNSLSGGTSRMVIFSVAGDDVVVVDPPEDIANIFETGPSMAYDLMKDFLQTHKPIVDGVGHNVSNYTIRPVSHCGNTYYYFGTSGNNIYYGTCNNEIALMRAGADICFMDGNIDTCMGEDGADSLYASSGADDGYFDILYGGNGNDTFYLYGSPDNAHGHAGTDTGNGCNLAGVYCASDIEIRN